MSTYTDTQNINKRHITKTYGLLNGDNHPSKLSSSAPAQCVGKSEHF